MKVIHFYNGLGGGVKNLISTLINFKINEEVEYEVIYILKKSIIEDFQELELKKSVKEYYFIYDSDWNFYHVISKLKKYISDNKAILIAHDWLELGMISQLKISNPIMCFLHGNHQYYFDLFERHSHNIDLFLVVSTAQKNKLLQYYDADNQDIIQYSLPVPDYKLNVISYEVFKILFIANDLNDFNKNFKFLPIINECLMDKGVKVEWHIVGGGKTEESISEFFNNSLTSIKYYGYILNQNLSTIYSNVNLFINCSDNEGLPISLIESMKHGIIPIVNSWNESAFDIIEHKVNGFVIARNIPEEYANVIFELTKIKEQLPIISKNAFIVATSRHSIARQIAEFELILLRLKKRKNNLKPIKIYGSRLDNPLIPNLFTTIARRLLRKIYG